MTFAPSPNFDPCDGADPRVELSRDNPCKPSDPRGPDTAGLSPAGEQSLLPSVTPPAAFSTSAHASGDSRG
jgi:hypothetical protein